MVGETFSHYRVLDKLGEGGMGVVYRAQDTRLSRQVALKILSASAVANPDRKKRFMQEARTASALNHPNIITVYDTCHRTPRTSPRRGSAVCHRNRGRAGRRARRRRRAPRSEAG